VELTRGMLVLLTVVAAAGWLVYVGRRVWRFNLRVRELWRLLEDKGRADRVREVLKDPLSNVPQTRYLFDDRDFEDPEVRVLKLELRPMWRGGVLSVLSSIPLMLLILWLWDSAGAP